MRSFLIGQGGFVIGEPPTKLPQIIPKSEECIVKPFRCGTSQDEFASKEQKLAEAKIKCLSDAERSRRRHEEKELPILVEVHPPPPPLVPLCISRLSDLDIVSLHRLLLALFYVCLVEGSASRGSLCRWLSQQRRGCGRGAAQLVGLLVLFPLS